MKGNEALFFEIKTFDKNTIILSEISFSLRTKEKKIIYFPYFCWEWICDIIEYIYDISKHGDGY